MVKSSQPADGRARIGVYPEGRIGAEIGLGAQGDSLPQLLAHPHLCSTVPPDPA